MKKRNLKNLALKKKTISKLEDNVKGGLISSLFCYLASMNCDIPTIGHDDGSICVSREANWCHGQ